MIGPLSPALLMMLVAIAALAALSVMNRFRLAGDRRLYGNSRFASNRDLRKSGLTDITETSILLGRHRGRPVGLGGQRFAILSAPTRSGKGVGVVIPNLLHYAGSVVVLDIKGENLALTSGWRQRCGQRVFAFNPFALDRRSHRWNPLAYVSADVDLRASELNSIAAMLYPDSDPQNRFWVGQARSAFFALAMYAFDRMAALSDYVGSESWRPTLGMIYRLSLPSANLSLQDAIRELAAQPYVSARAAQAFSGLTTQAEETFLSIMSTMREPLNAWLNPSLDAATGGNDFDLRELRRQRMSVYVVIPPSRLSECKLIVNLFFSQVMTLNTDTLPAEDPGLRHQCLLLMDEFTSVGKIEIITNAVSYMAGYNVRLLPIIQSVAQLDAVYGKELARTLITNHAAQVLFTPREQQDAKDYSEMLGDRSAKKESRSYGRERSSSLSEERRPLMLPQELKAMSSRKCLILVEGLAAPILADKLVYYSDTEFKRRLLPPVTIPRL